MVSCSSEKGIVLLLFEEEARIFIHKFRQPENSCLIDSKNEFLEKLELQLQEYFSGKRRKFSVELDLRGSDHQLKIWEKVQNIPFGETRNYGDIAVEMGGKNYTRVVANANAQNNILILIPCHRVIGSGNKLTGYRGGIERKRWLIGFERTFNEANNKDTLF